MGRPTARETGSRCDGSWARTHVYQDLRKCTATEVKGTEARCSRLSCTTCKSYGTDGRGPESLLVLPVRLRGDERVRLSRGVGEPMRPWPKLGPRPPGPLDWGRLRRSTSSAPRV